MRAGLWSLVSRCDPRLCRMFRDHYSCKNHKARRVSPGPGRTVCLMHRMTSFDAAAMWVWSFQQLGHLAGYGYCMVFRRVGGALASELILAAEEWVPQDLRPITLVTFVDEDKVPSENPGYCFKRAGWALVGRSEARGYLRLEKELR